MKIYNRINKIVLASLITASVASAQTIVDLSDTSVMSGTINNAIFSIDSTHPSGTGTFGRDSGGVFLTIQEDGVEEGYNTSAKNIMDTKRIPKWNHEITVADLNVVFLEGKLYVPFILDINESAKDDNRLLSLDDVKLFSTKKTAIKNPDLASLVNDSELNLLFDMDAGANNTVLLDYGRIGSGSGSADMVFLAPHEIFRGLESTDTIYLYSRFGGDITGASADTDADAGYEEWTLGTGTGSIPVPEPSSTLLLGLASAVLLSSRRRV